MEQLCPMVAFIWLLGARNRWRPSSPAGRFPGSLGCYWKWDIELDDPVIQFNRILICLGTPTAREVGLLNAQCLLNAAKHVQPAASLMCKDMFATDADGCCGMWLCPCGAAANMDLYNLQCIPSLGKPLQNLHFLAWLPCSFWRSLCKSVWWQKPNLQHLPQPKLVILSEAHSVLERLNYTFLAFLGFSVSLVQHFLNIEIIGGWHWVENCWVGKRQRAPLWESNWWICNLNKQMTGEVRELNFLSYASKFFAQPEPSSVSLRGKGVRVWDGE